MTTAATTPRAPGRPRSVRADEAIIDAVLTLLAEGSTIEGLSVEAVAAKAGVGKATIYRRWAHKEALVIDAIAAVKQPIAVLAGDSVRDDLIRIVRVTSRARDSRAAKIMPCLVPEIQRSGRLREQFVAIIERRRDVTREVLRRGIATGELRADTDVELVMTLLSGPMLSSLVGSAPLPDSDDIAMRLVDTILQGIAGPATSPLASPLAGSATSPVAGPDAGAIG